MRISSSHKEQLRELGNLLGHDSISQTLAHILNGYLEFEIDQARQYQSARQGYKDYREDYRDSLE